MGVELPGIPRAEFERRVRAAGRPPGIPAAALARLYVHFEELRRWNPVVALVGPGFSAEAPEQHYAESLAGMALLPAGAPTVLDIGSGAGFPGLILAAARPELRVVLTEARERKCAFLRSAAARMALQVRCLNVRVAEPPPQGLPSSIDVVTVRAVRIEPTLLAPVLPLLAADGRVLLWATTPPEELSGLELYDEHRLAGERRILAYRVRAPGVSD